MGVFHSLGAKAVEFCLAFMEQEGFG